MTALADPEVGVTVSHVAVLVAVHAAAGFSVSEKLDPPAAAATVAEVPDKFACP